MLRLTLIAAVAMIMCFSSCTKEKKIEGKWKITYAKEDGYNDKNAIGETWTFKENGTFVGYLSYFEQEVTAKWSIDGNELIIKGGDLEGSESGSGWSDSWEIIYTLDIDQLDNKNLVVSGKAKEIYTETEDGYTDTDTDSWSVSYELEAK